MNRKALGWSWPRFGHEFHPYDGVAFELSVLKRRLLATLSRVAKLFQLEVPCTGNLMPAASERSDLRLVVCAFTFKLNSQLRRSALVHESSTLLGNPSCIMFLCIARKVAVFDRFAYYCVWLPHRSGCSKIN